MIVLFSACRVVSVKIPQTNKTTKYPPNKKKNEPTKKPPKNHPTTKNLPPTKESHKQTKNHVKTALKQANVAQGT